MLTLEQRQYGSGYEVCLGCAIKMRISDLVDGRCVKCRPKHTCISCLIELESTNGQCTNGLWQCSDTLACAERVWRVNAKADEQDLEWQLMQSRGLGRPAPLSYAHHNAGCDYNNGQWSCPGQCGVSDPPLHPDDRIGIKFPG